MSDAQSVELATPVATDEAGQGDAWTQRRNKWGVYSPSELSRRCKESGAGDDLVEGIIPSRSLGIFVGDSGLGKSPLLYQLGICVAAGVPFLGRAVKQGTVLYLDFENGTAEVDEIVTTISGHLELSKPPEELELWNANDLPPDWGNQEYIPGNLIYQAKPTLLLIDPFTGLFPNIEEKNSVATQSLHDLRSRIGECGTTILGAHHIRKPPSDPQQGPASLEDESLQRWFLQARGARALINGCDVRLGLDRPGLSSLGTMNDRGQEEIALVLRGFRRVRGEIPLTYLSRVLDESGEPTGYKTVTGARLLFNDEREAAFAKLPPNFRFKDARQAYAKGDQATADFLKKCISLGILRKVNRAYEKLDPPE